MFVLLCQLDNPVFGNVCLGVEDGTEERRPTRLVGADERGTDAGRPAVDVAAESEIWNWRVRSVSEPSKARASEMVKIGRSSMIRLRERYGPGTAESRSCPAGMGR